MLFFLLSLTVLPQDRPIHIKDEIVQKGKPHISSQRTKNVGLPECGDNYTWKGLAGAILDLSVRVGM
jgi:hypothetical protein